jgi:hypothetical protein
MILTNKHIPRRLVLKGLGATVALPLLEAMIPARAAAAAASTRKLRLWQWRWCTVPPAAPTSA